MHVTYLRWFGKVWAIDVWDWVSGEGPYDNVINNPCNYCVWIVPGTITD